MGKCGGRELNYVSDVDVVYVAEARDGEDDGPALRTATQLATALMRVCADVAWPVDAGLRPEGGAGPLVRTLASHTAYYGRWAGTWEFQALLKARPLAGDLELGTRYLDAVGPLVWTAAGRPGFVEDVQAMRRRVVSTLKQDQTHREVKLGQGGLRDIEFAVQLLQLVHGRTDPAVRSGSTLPALAALAEEGYVGREDARHLAEAYRWLRTVEHRLQLHRLRRTHLLPADDDVAGLRRLARAVGYRADALELFARERNGYRREVRRLHEKLFYRPLLGAVARLPADDARLSPQAAGARLQALGFAEPAAALRHLDALTAGVSRRAVIQRTLLPVMLGWFAAAADPDAGLLGYRQVSDALGSTPWYLRLLRDEGVAAERLAGLLGTSRYVADLLVRAPEGVRLLGTDDELRPRTREALTGAFVSSVRRREDWEGAVGAARGLRRQELLRVACADLLGLVDLEQVGRALSDVAAATVQAALDDRQPQGRRRERRSPLPVRLAVLAMGRLGGDEQSWGSDADVLFVHEAEPGRARAAGRRRRPRRRQRDPPPARAARAGPAAARRRRPAPRGQAGPADPQPRLVRRLLRPLVAGVGGAGAAARGAARRRRRPRRPVPRAWSAPFRWPAGGLTDAQVVEVRRIKARVEKERMPRGVDPGLALKLGRGGLADVEWTVQLLQLRHGARGARPAHDEHPRGAAGRRRGRARRPRRRRRARRRLDDGRPHPQRPRPRPRQARRRAAVERARARRRGPLPGAPAAVAGRVPGRVPARHPARAHRRRAAVLRVTAGP